jgi:simple sugar transport system permease protein
MRFNLKNGHLKKISWGGWREKIADEKNLAPLLFIALALICFGLADVSPGFVLEQVLVRFIRNSVLVMALILPILGGMGLNFSIIVGAMTAQAAYIVVLNTSLRSGPGALAVFGLTLALNILIGLVIGRLMNRVKGREMIASIVIGLLANYIYQLIFLVGFGTLIPVHNPKLVLDSGIGVKSMLDLKTYRDFFNSFGTVQIGGTPVSFFLIAMILVMALLVYYITRTPLGQQIRTVGLSESKAEMAGIDVNRMRITAIVISTVLAGIGQFIYLQNIGSLNVYTEHLNEDTFSCAALLVGGATIKSATVRQALLGVVIMHALFILSPLAGQNSFDNVALGEYFRSFIVYGVIALALILNIRREKLGEGV